MDTNVVVTIIVSVLASGGLWTTIQLMLQRRYDATKVKTEDEKNQDAMLLGLGHDRIYSLCQEYIRRGNVTLDEYDNLLYLWKPYKSLGGNGTGLKLMAQVEKLPIVKEEHHNE